MGLIGRRELLQQKVLANPNLGLLDDLAFAGEKAATLKPRESGYFELPSGHSSKVHLPNGSVVDATHIWVRNNGSGTFHGHPLIK